MSLKNQTVMTSHAELINGVIEEETARARLRCEETVQEMDAQCELVWNSIPDWHDNENRRLDNDTRMKMEMFCDHLTAHCHWDKSNNMCVVDVYNSRTRNMLRDRCRQAIERLV